AALSGSAESTGAGARPVQESAIHVVPGGAAQYGRILVHAPLLGLGPRADRCQPETGDLCRPRRLGGNGHRPNVTAPQTASGSPRRGTGLAADISLRVCLRSPERAT